MSAEDENLKILATKSQLLQDLENKFVNFTTALGVKGAEGAAKDLRKEIRFSQTETVVSAIGSFGKKLNPFTTMEDKTTAQLEKKAAQLSAKGNDENAKGIAKIFQNRREKDKQKITDILSARSSIENEQQQRATNRKRIELQNQINQLKKEIDTSGISLNSIKKSTDAQSELESARTALETAKNTLVKEEEALRTIGEKIDIARKDPEQKAKLQDEVKTKEKEVIQKRVELVEKTKDIADKEKLVELAKKKEKMDGLEAEKNALPQTSQGGSRKTKTSSKKSYRKGGNGAEATAVAAGTVPPIGAEADASGDATSSPAVQTATPVLPLATLIKKYRGQVLITKEDYDTLLQAVEKFEKHFTDNTLPSSLKDTWYQTYNTTFGEDSPNKDKTDNNRSYTDTPMKKYVATLFQAYNQAIKDVSEKIKEEHPEFTQKQIEEELTKKIMKVLPPKEQAALQKGMDPGASGGPSGASREGDDSGEGTAAPQGFFNTAGTGLMAGFNVAYNVFGAFGAILVFATFFLSSIDILKFSVLEVWQYVMIFINPNMYNKDTLDFSTLYYHKNNEQDEPYTIYLQQELIALMFKLVQYFVYTLIIPIGIHVFFSVLRGLGKSTYNDSIDLSSAKKSLSVMGITIASAFIQNTYYNVSFRRSLQPDMIATNEDIQRMKDSLYDNMSTSSEFLESVVNENISDSIKLINAQGTRYQSIEKMIFTLSLYNFFKMNLSTNAPEFMIIRRMFTVPEIRIREINPIDYMYFSQNVFLPNLYPMLVPYISGTGKVLETKVKQDIVRKGVSNRLSVVNRLLMGLFTVPNRRSSFRNYIYLGWILSFAFVVGIYSIYSVEIDYIYEKFLVPFLKGINEFIWNIVFPLDTRSKKPEGANA